MLLELKAAKEIAIDLEHHEYRSYYGIVSLMQISTRNKDWIVDTLTPWRHKLQVLNEVFADPGIVKVFHGSSMDMIWLQRDLGLYVVGLFDTYYACEALQFPGRGLKYLLQRFANFEAQKQYQMADWRIRPLPFELIDYARADTHYLLYIYDCLRNMLIEQSTPQTNLIDHVSKGSKSEAAQTYTRFIYNKESGRGSHGWYNLFTEHSNRFMTKQFAVFRALHEWRDKKAREEDEGLAFIFSNKLLWILAENMPTTQTALWSIKPLPQAVSLHSSEFLNVVQKAIQEAESDPMPHEFLRQNEDKYGIPQNRWRKAKEEKPKTQLTGVGATLQQLTQNGEVASIVNASTTLGPPVADRAQQSTLWGKITNAMSDVSIETAAASAALQTILPLPDLSGESFAEVNGIHSPDTSPEMPLAAPPSPPTPSKAIVNEVNEPFTLKQQSRKRKAEEIELSDDEQHESLTTPVHSSRATATTNGDTSPTSPDAMDTRHANPKHEAKRLAKQKKKAEKKARKAAMEAEAAAQAANMVPFDYASAENLIDLTNDPRERSLPDDRSPRSSSAKKAKKDGKSKPMNPFAKALDTSTGVRKKMGNAKELGGRSMTFQS
jgi:exosome complex exonuclease RRP6